MCCDHLMGWEVQPGEWCLVDGKPIVREGIASFLASITAPKASKPVISIAHLLHYIALCVGR
jgi:hypothetical protein